MINNMIRVRKNYNYGEQDDYFDDPAVIGWIRRGDDEHKPLAVLISIRDMAEKQMHVGESEAGASYVDLSGKNEDVIIDEQGNGVFTVGPGQVTYWANKETL